MLGVSRDDLVKFASRDWTTIAQAKEQHWLRKKWATSALDLWRLSDGLRSSARMVRPEGPTLAERLADLEVHRRVSLALRAVTAAIR
jgi:hypothetical protein